MFPARAPFSLFLGGTLPVPPRPLHTLIGQLPNERARRGSPLLGRDPPGRRARRGRRRPLLHRLVRRRLDRARAGRGGRASSAPPVFFFRRGPSPRPPPPPPGPTRG